MITPNEYSEQDVEDALLRNAYAEGRADERAASHVDELVAALEKLLRADPSDMNFVGQDVDGHPLCSIGVARLEARAILAKVKA